MCQGDLLLGLRGRIHSDGRSPLVRVVEVQEPPQGILAVTIDTYALGGEGPQVPLARQRYRRARSMGFLANGCGATAAMGQMACLTGEAAEGIDLASRIEQGQEA